MSSNVVKLTVMFCDPLLSMISIIFHYQSLSVSQTLVISPKTRISDWASCVALSISDTFCVF